MINKVSKIFTPINKNNNPNSLSDTSAALSEKEQMHNNSYFYNPRHPVWSGTNYTELAKNGFCSNPIVYAAIRLVTRAAALLTFSLYEVADDGKKHPVSNHPILDLLRNPNPMQGGREFLEELYSCRMISGNAYVLGVETGDKRIKEMHILRPDRVQIISGDNLSPYAYRYTIDGNVREYGIDSDTGASQILHLRDYHPLSDWYGLSSLEVASFSVDQHNQASAWNQSLLQNGARPSGAVIVKNSLGQGCRLNPEQFAQLKGMFDEIYSGPQNAGRPLLLEGGLEWKTISMSPRDMDFIESKNNAAREIALTMGVPPQLLGIPGDNTYSNLAEARLAMWEQTVLPLVENTLNHFESWIMQYWQGASFSLVCDVEKINVLAKRTDAVWERLERNNFMTINEKRQAVGLPEVEGGDRLEAVSRIVNAGRQGIVKEQHWVSKAAAHGGRSEYGAPSFSTVDIAGLAAAADEYGAAGVPTAADAAGAVVDERGAPRVLGERSVLGMDAELEVDMAVAHSASIMDQNTDGDIDGSLGGDVGLSLDERAKAELDELEGINMQDMRDIDLVLAASKAAVMEDTMASVARAELAARQKLLWQKNDADVDADVNAEQLEEAIAARLSARVAADKYNMLTGDEDEDAEDVVTAMADPSLGRSRIRSPNPNPKVGLVDEYGDKSEDSGKTVRVTKGERLALVAKKAKSSGGKSRVKLS